MVTRESFKGYKIFHFFSPYFLSTLTIKCQVPCDYIHVYEINWDGISATASGLPPG